VQFSASDAARAASDVEVCTMRGALAVLVGAMVALVGCADDDTASPLRRGGPAGSDGVTTTDDQSGAPSETGATPAELACAAAPAATALSDAKTALNVRIVGQAVFFRDGSTVKRVLKDATGAKDVYSSPNLVQSFVDRTAMLLVETTADAPEATLRVIKAVAPEVKEGEQAPPKPVFPEFPAVKEGVAPGVAVATNFNAAGTRAFASDETSFYVLADTANGDTIVKVNKNNPAVQTVLVTSPYVISNPQIASGAVWWVRDNNRVFKAALADEENGVPQGVPTEVFGIQYASCNLAVGESAAYCSVGIALERRDLTGGNPMTILDAQKSKTQALFGPALNHNGSIFVRSAAPDAMVKHVIRAIRPGEGTAEEQLVACGRALVTDLAVDGTHVAWTEEGAGVFIAPLQ
jgi:hypothetical protein